MIQRFRLAPLLLLVLASGCGGGARHDSPGVPQDLESAAIERGLVRDPDDTDPTGLYARDTDRLCIVPANGAFRIGAYVDYGDGIGCSGKGTATRVGETLHVELGEKGACRFDARFDGDRIVFPGRVPDACVQLCERRASFTGLAATRLSESQAEAVALRDARGRMLCK